VTLLRKKKNPFRKKRTEGREGRNEKEKEQSQAENWSYLSFKKSEGQKHSLNDAAVTLYTCIRGKGGSNSGRDTCYRDRSLTRSIGLSRHMTYYYVCQAQTVVSFQILSNYFFISDLIIWRSGF
jgi:hypothetical protein